MMLPRLSRRPYSKIARVGRRLGVLRGRQRLGDAPGADRAECLVEIVRRDRHPRGDDTNCRQSLRTSPATRAAAHLVALQRRCRCRDRRVLSPAADRRPRPPDRRSRLCRSRWSTRRRVRRRPARATPARAGSTPSVRNQLAAPNTCVSPMRVPADSVEPASAAAIHPRRRRQSARFRAARRGSAPPSASEP